jgi:hypothetical protein
MITTKEHQAAEEAVGWDLPVHDIKIALQKWSDTNLTDMKKTLATSVSRFEAAGARGVTLADEIDMLRIAIAVREIRENG